MKNDGELFPRPHPAPEVASIRESMEGDITLTLRKGKFAEFLFGFLGSRETLTKTYQGDFVAGLEDLLQFHYLLTQKITKEMYISLSTVAATFTYDDKTTRTINTIETLESFREHRDVGVTAFSMTWNLIFRVPDEDTVQQQKVTFLLETRSPGQSNGNINVSIEHTNQVWAAEVQRLFEEQIGKIKNDRSVTYRILELARRLQVFSIFAQIFVAIVVLGGIYVVIERRGLLTPNTVQDEFPFDVADVVLENSQLDGGLYMQFFLIRDLYKTDPQIIRHLSEANYFRPEFKDVIGKMISGYYQPDKKSERIVHTLEGYIREQEKIHNIKGAWKLLRFAVIYLFLFGMSAIYLRLFRLASIISITTKEAKRLARQERDTSLIVQFVYGVGASIVATVIFQYGGSILLLR